MRKLLLLLVCVSTLAVFATGCQKSNEEKAKEAAEEAQKDAKKALDNLTK